MARPTKRHVLRLTIERVLALASVSAARIEIETLLWCLRGDKVVYAGIWNAYTYLYHDYQGPAWMNSAERAAQYVRDILIALRSELDDINSHSEVEPDV